MSATVLVTGASGLLGRPTVRHLRQAGHAVVATDVVDPPEREADVEYRTLTVGEVTAADLDGVDAVLHLGALTLSAEKSRFGASTDVVDARTMLGVNVSGTEQLFRLACETGVAVVVHASTAGVYGRPWEAAPPGIPVPPDGPFRPGSLYAHTKLLCEGLAAHYAKQRRARFVGMRPTFSYGLERLTGISGAFAAFVADAVQGHPATLGPPFGASGYLQLIYVEDMARSLVTATDWALAGGSGPEAVVLNSPTRERLSLREIVDTLRELTGNTEVRVAEEHVDAEMVMPVMDTETSARLLDFTQQYPFRAAVADMAVRLGSPLSGVAGVAR